MSFGLRGAIWYTRLAALAAHFLARRKGRLHMGRRRVYVGFLRLLLPALMLGVLASCGAPAPEDQPSPQDRLDEAAARIGQVTSLDFTLGHEQGVTPLVSGIVLQQAEGTVEGPDRATVDVEALVAFTNSYIEMSIVIEGESATMSDPLSGNPVPVATSELPFNLHSLGITLSGILRAVTGPAYAGDETVDGVASKVIAGSISGAAIQPLIPGADAGLSQDIEVWVGVDDLTRKVRITGKVLASDEEPVIRVLSFRNFDSARVP